MSLNLEHLHRIHCVGVGGIGVSAVAKLLRLQGKEVSGSDAVMSVVTEEAAKAGVSVKPEDPENVTVDLDLLIYTPAAPETHPERVAAAKLGIPQFSYPEFLGLLSRSYETIAVCGTNGKSTTTAMLGLILEAAGLDPLVIVGSRVPTFTYGNLRPGKGKILVVETCEYRGALLNIEPKHAVVTNVTEDHLDYFRDLAHIRETFQAFVDKLPEDGTLVVNADDRVAGSELKSKGRLRTFGLGTVAGIQGRDIVTKDGRQFFSVSERGGIQWGPIRLRIPGAFNVQNALGAISMARQLGVAPDVIIRTLEAFTGIWRRFEHVGDTAKGAPVYSDYGHHPDAVRATLAATREFFPDRRIVLCFQPHHHDRTRKLFDDFVGSFDGTDVLILAEIYGVTGRKEGEGEISSKDLIRAVEERDRHEGRGRIVSFAADPEAAKTEIESVAASNDVILVMGAGDIYTIASKLII